MFSQFELDSARQAIQDLYGSNIEIGNPVPFVRGYDNVTGGAAAISNFNNLMLGSRNFSLSGRFGKPNVIARDLTSNYPHTGSTWSAVAFVTTGGGAFQTWTGSIPGIANVTIDIDTIALTFTGTILGFGQPGSVAGTATVNGAGVYTISTATITFANLLVNIFYGKLSWGVYNDNLGLTQNQIATRFYHDLAGAGYAISLNITKTLTVIAPSLLEFAEGTTQPVLVQNAQFSARCILNFDGALFALKII